MTNLIQTPLGRLRIVAFLEGCSYLLLAITMPIKYVLHIPQPNYVVGMIHGVLFIAYVALVFQVAFLHKWTWKNTSWALAASVVPFGTFVAEYRLFRK